MIDKLRKFSEHIAVILLTAMFATFLLQIFTRYVLNSPLGWTVELCIVLYIWTIFWTAAFLLKEKDHVAFKMVYDAAPKGRKRIMVIVGFGLVGLSFAFSLPSVINYIDFMKIDSTPVMRLRYDWVYSIFGVFVIAVVVRSVFLLVRLFGKDWQEEIDDTEPKDTSV